MRALIVGYGRSGRAAEALLSAQGHEVVVLADETRDVPTGDFDVAIVSPGVALSHPWLVEARRRSIPLKSELQLGCEELKRRGWKLLGVTGSKGKSSVVKAVADAIVLAGGRAVPCGNYGTPVCEVALSHPVGWAVIEVSSFMLETTVLVPDAFEAAAILNLQEDHLDRHGSVEAYHALKRRLLNFTRRGLSEAEVLVSAEASDAPWVGSYFDNEVLRTNGALAAELMRAAGLDDAAVRRAFASFESLPHRMKLVAELDGVRYVDDSKATSLAALAAGVRMTRGGVRLIAGGLPKGDDPKSVLPVLTERVKKVYLIGQSAVVFSAAWSGAVDCEVCDTLAKAVENARREAVKGETVLLSPGTASYDQFKSFEERGEVFAALVKKERKDK